MVPVFTTICAMRYEKHSIDSLCVIVCLYLVASEKSSISRLYNSLNLQPVLEFSISNSKLRHPQSKVIKPDLTVKQFIRI